MVQVQVFLYPPGAGLHHFLLIADTIVLAVTFAYVFSVTLRSHYTSLSSSWLGVTGQLSGLLAGLWGFNLVWAYFAFRWRHAVLRHPRDQENVAAMLDRATTRPFWHVWWSSLRGVPLNGPSRSATASRQFPTPAAAVAAAAKKNAYEPAILASVRTSPVDTSPTATPAILPLALPPHGAAGAASSVPAGLDGHASAGGRAGAALAMAMAGPNATAAPPLPRASVSSVVYRGNTWSSGNGHSLTRRGIAAALGNANGSSLLMLGPNGGGAAASSLMPGMDGGGDGFTVGGLPRIPDESTLPPPVPSLTPSLFSPTTEAALAGFTAAPATRKAPLYEEVVVTRSLWWWVVLQIIEVAKLFVTALSLFFLLKAYAIFEADLAATQYNNASGSTIHFLQTAKTESLAAVVIACVYIGVATAQLFLSMVWIGWTMAQVRD
ncbi:hypothetical protein CXG81DRAFT_26341 [Caulochytrium protostelioides]|uniref:Uncharacterized protein n=1 Tax=Caulochytrium protostelioides TaxID=1555241 RepID=A0A4P9X6Z5_9FUNG|nr:hypothetical protein CXG81DRAFT_26341 [Caulochytrium protostelioides]|eukprot:RKP00984.1 hypothetical protein CXG81DRAFT_26341 [Caulochytrium protostelioides]